MSGDAYHVTAPSEDGEHALGVVALLAADAELAGHSLSQPPRGVSINTERCTGLGFGIINLCISGAVDYPVRM